mmetsp:Transcript_12541/g.34962  ORF Transcript_12541/g.34962 Transcript_12541/m.34962 type:complete len:312 (+) Transcript_12541:586-1521(+)
MTAMALPWKKYSLALPLPTCSGDEKVDKPRLKVGRSKSTSRARRVATAAAAFSATFRCPGWQTSQSTSPFPRTLKVNRDLMPSSPLARLPRILTSQCSPLPNEILSTPRGGAILETWASSAFNTQTSPGLAPSRSSALASATPSMVPPTPSRWARPTFVTTLTPGSQIDPSCLISPNRSMPSSSTQKPASEGSLRMVRGTPIRLLLFPSVSCTAPSPRIPLRRWETIDLVVVFPQEPVIPTTFPGYSLRTLRAKSCSVASPPELPATDTSPAFAPSPMLLTNSWISASDSVSRTTPAHPLARASNAKSLPS